MFYKNLKQLKTDLDTKDEDYWQREGEKMALKLFHETAQRVPAYKKFLKANHINPVQIKTITDFKKIPLIDKKNYLLKYPLEQLCWDGQIEKTDMISLSSGSSGKPFFWLRSKEQEAETVLNHELFLLDSFEINKHSTLFIVSFAMGMWVAGTLTQRAVQSIAEKHRMTVVAPGINKQDVLKIIKKIGGKYDQIVIAGYPPFVKDIIDDGGREKIDWKKHNIKFLFAAESFSEKWREYIYKKVGARNYLKDSLNIYGTADALILGHETPLSILIRRLADGDKVFYKDLFKHDTRVPTLVQYNPLLRYFELVNYNLIFSSFSGIPLVRYAIGDTGGIIPFSKMTFLADKNKINLEREIKSSKISNWKLPFLYVHGRSDFTATLYGINVYPENIREALNEKGIDKEVSGKFIMFTRNDKKMNQYLDLIVELKDGITTINSHLGDKIKNAIINTLKIKNNEYNELCKSIGAQAEPQIKLCQYGDKEFFTPGVKQIWHRKK